MKSAEIKFYLVKSSVLAKQSLLMIDSQIRVVGSGELTLKKKAVSEERAGEPGQPGDQEQGAGGEQDTPVTSEMTRPSILSSDSMVQ